MAVTVVERRVSVEFVFDRASERAVADAYRVLVPERRARGTHRRDVDEHSQDPTVDEGEQRPALGA